MQDKEIQQYFQLLLQQVVEVEEQLHLVHLVVQLHSLEDLVVVEHIVDQQSQEVMEIPLLYHLHKETLVVQV
jgi:hypothetical protein